MVFLIDITGTCNLRCPSCPVGNFKDKLTHLRPKGFMPVELFCRVVEKARSDCARYGLPFFVELYNWGEPLIHPHIGEILAFLHNENIAFGISSNFNTKMDLSLLVRYPPHFLRVSVSGFEQEMYAKGHQGGQIEQVKNNLKTLRQLMDTHDQHFSVHVFYLIYKDNCDENIQKMFAFTVELNFNFFVGLAYMMPLENLIYALDESHISPNDWQVLKRLCFTPKEAFDLTKNLNLPQRDCALLNSQVVINYDGTVALCCAVYSPEFSQLAHYLDVDLHDLQILRAQHPLCKICMENKIHFMVVQQPMDVYNRALRRKQMEWNVPYFVNLETFQGKFLKEPLVKNPAFKKE